MSIAGAMITSKSVDLSNCDREQIQYSGAIQPHGVLLVLQDPELTILQASRNTAVMLGLPAETLVGTNLLSVFSQEQVSTLRSLFLPTNREGPPLHVLRAEFCGRTFNVLAHRCNQSLLLELEQRDEIIGATNFDLYSGLHGAIARIESSKTLQSFLDLAALEVSRFTGFDRVMIYKFLEDKSGWVRSEVVTEGMEPYLGLHYPASDIPEPARRLFSLSWVRHQPDIAYTPVPIFPEFNPLTGKALDMSYALLRSVSVMYVDYLKNMGTTASFVMTLLKGGELWGLIACHHHTGPRHVPYEVRVACEFLAQTISLLMSAKEDLESHQYRAKLKTTQQLMTANIARRGDFAAGLMEDSPNLMDFVEAGGTSIVINDHISLLGATPAAPEIKQIVTWLSTAMSQNVFATDCLSAYLPEAAACKDVAAGLLALRFSQTKSDFILWFRPEIIQSVHWAGDPNKPVDVSTDGQRLIPRGSFALWKETVSLKSSTWREVELEAVQELRAALLELVLQRADELGKLYADLERHAKLDSFAYVASHDLKEPLRGISNYAEMLSNAYADKVDDAGKAKFATISRLCRRMGELLDSLHEYSRLGQQDLSHSDVDLNQVVSQACDLLQVRIEDAGVTVCIPRTLPTVKADGMIMVQVFMNLLSNAIKYNDKAAKEVEISYEVSTLGQPVFYVRDNGIGIAENHFEQIFLIFRRLHPVGEFGGGSGAGLTIIREIIHRLGGRIWLKSALGQGTTFYFTLGSDEVTRPTHAFH